MKRTTIIALAATTLGLGAASITVTSAARSEKGSKMPAELETLQRMAGKWRGKVQYAFGPMKGTAEVSLDCTPTSGGAGVRCDSRFDGMPMGPVHETDLFGYDAGSNQYHWFAVTSLGETHDHVADVRKDGKLDWIYSGREDGKAMQEIIHMAISRSGKRLSFDNVVTVDGKQKGTLAGKLTRR